jgi:hypothetical protein
MKKTILRALQLVDLMPKCSKTQNKWLNLISKIRKSLINQAFAHQAPLIHRISEIILKNR